VRNRIWIRFGICSLDINLRFNVSDDDVYSLDRHLVKFELLRAEAVVGDDGVGVLLGWLDEALKGRLGLLLVCLE